MRDILQMVSGPLLSFKWCTGKEGAEAGELFGARELGWRVYRGDLVGVAFEMEDPIGGDPNPPFQTFQTLSLIDYLIGVASLCSAWARRRRRRRRADEPVPKWRQRRRWTHAADSRGSRYIVDRTLVV